MADIQVAILQVAVRNTSNGRTVYDVGCGDGVTRQVWEANLANAINAYSGTGQPISIREQVSQRGQYTNRTIKAFAPPGQALPPDTGDGGSPGGGGFRGGGRPGGMSPEDKTRIAKMGAQGSASTLVAALFQGAGPEAYDEAVALMEKLTKQLYKDARSHEKPESQTQVLQTGADGAVLPQGVLPVVGQAVATPQAVAAVVPGVTVGAPVATAQDAAAEAPQAAPSDDDINWN